MISLTVLACEPLAYFLSKFMGKDMWGDIDFGCNNKGEDYNVDYLLRLYREAKIYMDKFPPGLTCSSLLSLNNYLRQDVKSPNFWEHVKDSDLENPSFKDFFFRTRPCKNQYYESSRVLEKKTSNMHSVVCIVLSV